MSHLCSGIFDHGPVLSQPAWDMFAALLLAIVEKGEDHLEYYISHASSPLKIAIVV